MKQKQYTVVMGGLLLGMVVLMALVPLVQGQEQAAQPPAPQNSTTLWDLIMAGGWAMIPLGLFSVAVIALIIRNFLAINEDKLLRPDIYDEIQEKLLHRDIFGAYLFCKDETGLLPGVLEAGLERVTSEEVSIDSIKEAIEEAGTEEMMTMMGPISYLSIIGAVSPMVGLLGTVSGMIKAFQNIAAGGMGKAELLADNIGEALVTTATGLIIAIPAMLFYFFFKNRFMKIMATMGRQTGRLMDILITGELPMSMRDPREHAAPQGHAPIQGEGNTTNITMDA